MSLPKMMDFKRQVRREQRFETFKKLPGNKRVKKMKSK